MKMHGVLSKNYEEFQDGTNRALNQALATRASGYHSRSRRAGWSLPTPLSACPRRPPSRRLLCSHFSSSVGPQRPAGPSRGTDKGAQPARTAGPLQGFTSG